MADPTYNYLDYDGLALYDEKIKQLIGTKVDKDGSKVLSTNDYTTEEKNKLAGITAGAEPNQNVFTTVAVDGTSLSADSKTDTLTITAGDNVTLTPTASSDSFVIAATDTTYPEATATTGGVLTDAQAVKLNGIATGATKNTASTTTPKMNGTAAVGKETAYAKGDHVHPTDTSRAAAVHTHKSTDINSNQVTSVALADDDLIAIFDASDSGKLKPSTISGTYFPKPSSSNPLMDGTASAGTGTEYSRANHVHPTDTSRASAADLSALQDTVDDKADKATTLSGYGITDAYTKNAVDDMIGLAERSIPSAGTTAPKMDGTAAVGTATTYAREDHVHPTDMSLVPKSASKNGQTTAIDNDGTSVHLKSEKGSNYADVQLGRSGNATVSLYASTTNAHSELIVSPTGVNIDKVVTPTTDTMPTPKSYVDTAIANAIGDIQGISYEVVQTLPATGQAGVIYLVPNSGSAPNIYDEYIWTGTAFEKIGTTDVDLSGYQPKMDAITNTQINALFA